jgi:hypothetical protein
VSSVTYLYDRDSTSLDIATMSASQTSSGYSGVVATFKAAEAPATASFSSSGISTDTGSSTVVTVNGGNYPQGSLPYMTPTGSTAYSFATVVATSTTKNYVLQSVSGDCGQTLQSNTFTASASCFVTATYRAQYAIEYLQSTSATVTGTGPNTLTFTHSPANGNLEVLLDAGNSYSSSHITNIAQTGATWHEITYATGGYLMDAWYAYAISGASTTLSITKSATGSHWLIAAEYTWIASGDPLDKYNSQSGTSSSACTGTTATTTYTPELWIAGIMSGSSQSAPTNSFGLEVSGTSTNTLYEKDVSSTDGAGMCVTQTSSSYAGVIVTFKTTGAPAIVAATFTSSGISGDTGSATVVTVNSANYGQGSLPVMAAAGVVTYSFASAVSAGDCKQYVFVTVSGCSQSLQSNTFTPSSACTVTGTYTPQYALIITVSGSGTTTPPAGTSWYNEGTDASVSETPADGWMLENWTLDGTPAGTDNPIHVTMSTSHALTAVFQTAIVGSIFLNAVSPQYYRQGVVVSFSGGTNPQTSSVQVTITVKDHLDVTVFTEQVTTEETTGAFSGQFTLNMGGEGLDTIHATAAQFNPASTTFLADFTPPTSTVTAPANQTTTYTPPSSIVGTFSDPLLTDGNPGSGVITVTITIQRVSDEAYWTGSAWGAETWLFATLNQPASGQITLDLTAVSWTMGDYKIIQNTTDTAGNFHISGTTIFTYESRTTTVVTALDAYHGARLSWTAVSGIDSYNINYTVQGGSSQFFVSEPSSILSLDVSTLPVEAWGQDITWTVTPVVGGVPLLDSSGSATALSSRYMVESLGAVVIVSNSHELKIRLNFKSVTFTPILSGIQIGEVLDTNPTPEPIIILSMSPVYLASYGSTGYYIIDFTPQGGFTPGVYHVWFFLWSSLPSDNEPVWEPYIVKVDVPVTIE